MQGETVKFTTLRRGVRVSVVYADRKLSLRMTLERTGRVLGELAIRDPAGAADAARRALALVERVGEKTAAPAVAALADKRETWVREKFALAAQALGVAIDPAPLGTGNNGQVFPIVGRADRVVKFTSQEAEIDGVRFVQTARNGGLRLEGFVSFHSAVYDLGPAEGTTIAHVYAYVRDAIEPPTRAEYEATAKIRWEIADGGAAADDETDSRWYTADAFTIAEHVSDQWAYQTRAKGRRDRIARYAHYVELIAREPGMGTVASDLRHLAKLGFPIGDVMRKNIGRNHLGRQVIFDFYTRGPSPERLRVNAELRAHAKEITALYEEALHAVLGSLPRPRAEVGEAPVPFPPAAAPAPTVEAPASIVSRPDDDAGPGGVDPTEGFGWTPLMSYTRSDGAVAAIEGSGSYRRVTLQRDGAHVAKANVIAPGGSPRGVFLRIAAEPVSIPPAVRANLRAALADMPGLKRAERAMFESLIEGGHARYLAGKLYELGTRKEGEKAAAFRDPLRNLAADAEAELPDALMAKLDRVAPKHVKPAPAAEDSGASPVRTYWPFRITRHGLDVGQTDDFAEAVREADRRGHCVVTADLAPADVAQGTAQSFTAYQTPAPPFATDAGSELSTFRVTVIDPTTVMTSSGEQTPASVAAYRAYFDRAWALADALGCTPERSAGTLSGHTTDVPHGSMPAVVNALVHTLRATGRPVAVLDGSAGSVPFPLGVEHVGILPGGTPVLEFEVRESDRHYPYIELRLRNEHTGGKHPDEELVRAAGFGWQQGGGEDATLYQTRNVHSYQPLAFLRDRLPRVYAALPAPWRAAFEAMAPPAPPPPPDEEVSVWLSLPLPDAEARAVAVEGGEPPEKLHLTALYIGKMKRAAFEEKRWFFESKLVAMTDFGHPVSALTGAVATFDNPERTTHYLAVDSPMARSLHARLRGAASEAGFKVDGTHDYVPHVTLMQTEPGVDPGIPFRRPRLIYLDRLVLHVGDDARTFTLLKREENVSHSGVPVRGALLAGPNEVRRSEYEGKRYLFVSFKLPGGAKVDDKLDRHMKFLGYKVAKNGAYYGEDKGALRSALAELEAANEVLRMRSELARIEREEAAREEAARGVIAAEPLATGASGAASGEPKPRPEPPKGTTIEGASAGVDFTGALPVRIDAGEVRVRRAYTGQYKPSGNGMGLSPEYEGGAMARIVPGKKAPSFLRAREIVSEVAGQSYPTQEAFMFAEQGGAHATMVYSLEKRPDGLYVAFACDASGKWSRHWWFEVFRGGVVRITDNQRVGQSWAPKGDDFASMKEWSATAVGGETSLDFREARTPRERWAEQGILYLEGMDPDRALERNDVGFNAGHSQSGMVLAHTIRARGGLTEAQWREACDIAIVYSKTQIGPPPTD